MTLDVMLSPMTTLVAVLAGFGISSASTQAHTRPILLHRGVPVTANDLDSWRVRADGTYHEAEARGEGRLDASGDAWRGVNGELLASPVMPPTEGVGRAESGLGEQRQSELQVCEAGDSFSVTSTLYPLAEGCYFLVDEESDIYAIANDIRVILPGEFVVASSTTSGYTSYPDTYWVTGSSYTDGIDLYVDVECLSLLDSYESGSHPANVEYWTCLIGGNFLTVEEDSFTADCGCSDAPTPSSVSSSPVEASGCSDTDAFFLSSKEFDAGGCYTDAGVTNAIVFTTTGEAEARSTAIYSDFADEDENDERWIFGLYTPSSTTDELYCISQSSPSETHPVDSVWSCDTTGFGTFQPVTNASVLSLECGCDSGTPAPATAASTETPTSAEEATTSASDGAAAVDQTSSPASASTSESDPFAAADADAAMPRLLLPSLAGMLVVAFAAGTAGALIMV